MSLKEVKPNNLIELKSKPNEQIINILEEALAKAKEGNIQGIFLTFIEEPHKVNYGCFWGGQISFCEVLGSVENAKFRTMREWKIL